MEYVNANKITINLHKTILVYNALLDHFITILLGNAHAKKDLN